MKTKLNIKKFDVVIEMLILFQIRWLAAYTYYYIYNKNKCFKYPNAHMYTQFINNVFKLKLHFFFNRIEELIEILDSIEWGKVKNTIHKCKLYIHTQTYIINNRK